MHGERSSRGGRPLKGRENIKKHEELLQSNKRFLSGREIFWKQIAVMVGFFCSHTTLFTGNEAGKTSEATGHFACLWCLLTAMRGSTSMFLEIRESNCYHKKLFLMT